MFIVKWKDLHKGNVWYLVVDKVVYKKGFFQAFYVRGHETATEHMPGFVEFWGRESGKSVKEAVQLFKTKKVNKEMIPSNDRGIVSVMKWKN